MPQTASTTLRIARSIPNVLTVLRLGLAVLLPLSPTRWWMAIVAGAGASDWLDGYLARKLRAQSTVGGLLDGLADKAFVVTALVTFTLHGRLELWQLPLLVLRDVVVLCGVLHSAWNRDRDAFNRMDSRSLGKLATATLFLLFLEVLVWPGAGPWHTPFFALAAVVNALAAADYARHRWPRREPV